MAKRPPPQFAGRHVLNRQRRRPLYCVLALCLATTAGSGTAVAQSANLPLPNTLLAPINTSGAAGADQSGASGGTASPIDFELTTGYTAGSVSFTANGGSGGTGVGGDDPSGNGGTGGNAANVTFNLDPGAYVNSGVTGPAAIALTSNGGAGGNAGELSASIGNPGQPGAGGNAAAIVFNQSGSVASTNGWNNGTPGTTAILMTAMGGAAAEPQDNREQAGGITGVGGNTGGAGGSITYNLSQGSVTSAGSAIVALSEGGAGGDGTGAYSTAGEGTGGNGGTGGAGGDVSMTVGQGTNAPVITAAGASTAATGAVVPIDDSGNTATTAVMAAGIQAQSIGGLGGAGGLGDGGSGKAGAGGAAGDAGAIDIALNSASISTTGFAAAGVLAQSIGGAGGNGGGAGGMFRKDAGNGAAGGNAGGISVTLGDAANSTWPSDLIATNGDDSMGVTAQSVGGGGGAGGAVSLGAIAGGVAIGGNGESGGAASTVTLNNGALGSGSSPAEAGFIIATQGKRSSGLVAQSIGGGGGTGGAATGDDVGAFTYTVGGSGGSGGAAGTPGTTQVSLLNMGIVSTSGDHAKGVVAQAIGGGGGDGGAALSYTAGAGINIDTTIGGSGGTAGSAGDVVAFNNGEILTSGSDAWGMAAQSIAGGGGNGGGSTADAVAIAAPDIPSIVINTSVGGHGGDGAASGNVTVANNGGVIMTAGAAAHGVLAQSISGGGGNGGDSSALTAAAGPTSSQNFNLTVSVGGNGGSGGQAGNVNVDNGANAFIWTLGDSADGIFAQSVGGGGGSGGASKDTTKVALVKNTGSASFSVGGNGGTGSTGGAVTVTNEGNILTIGDSANGIFAQSVGGGGGLSTGGTIKGSGPKQTETITVTGGGNAAGNGGAVNVTNDATIVTYGGEAAGIFAQSVGGGGGKAGTGSTAGLPSSSGSLGAYLAQSQLLSGNLGNYAGVKAWGPQGWYLTSYQQMESYANDYLKYAQANAANNTPDPSGVTATLNMFIGGGTNLTNEPPGSSTQGDGGDVTATNNFDVLTSGPASSGMIAQSVGGGGGEGGATVVSQMQDSSTPYNVEGTVVVGGNVANTGNGGAVSATNNLNIDTTGDASFGILAQSVGGGGGESIVTASNPAPTSNALQITLGGSLGTTGDGGQVTVANNGNIATSGNGAVGIVAQSVGGGGGNVVVLDTKGTPSFLTGLSAGAFSPADLSNTVTVGSNAIAQTNYATCKSTNLLTNACGDGGTVAVSTSAGSNVKTTGFDAHGVLAQSIGGGGGWVSGTSGAGGNPFNNPSMIGNGGDINLSLAGNIQTSGAGSYGVMAQSVGAGGVLAGDMELTAHTIAFPNAGDQASYYMKGNGGAITIANSGTIATTGFDAHAIFAQSVGGGGGYYSTVHGVQMGTAGGFGNQGAVSITNSGAVSASGQSSSAIFVDTQGAGDESDVTINNTASGTITGNASAPAIMLMGNNSNGDGLVINNGTIANTNGTAIYSQSTNSGPDSYGGVTNYGTLIGNVDIGEGPLNTSGYWATNDSSTVGTTINSGTLDIYGADPGNLGVSTLNGSLTNSGVIRSTVDFYNQQAGTLLVTGNAALGNGSSLLINPVSLTPGKYGTIMEVQGNFTQSASAIPVTDIGRNYLFNYTALDSWNTLVVSANPTSHFTATAQQDGFSGPILNLTGYLDTNWTSGMSQSLASTYASLAKVTDSASYAAALMQVGSEGTAAATVAHAVASNAFVERMNSCPRFDGGDAFQHEHDCVWGRAITNSADMDTSSDSVGYHQSGQVFQLGGQKEVAQDWFVGASVSSDHTSLDTQAVNDSVSGHGWTAGVIGKHQMGDWLVSAALEGGETTYDSTREANLYGLGGTAQARFDVTHWGLHSRISRQVAFDHWYLKPYVDLHATHIDSDGYTEHGAGALDLNVASAHTNLLGASPMLEADSKIDFGGDSTLQIYGGLGGTFYSQGSLGANMQLAEAQGPIYFNQTSEVPQRRLKTTAGLDLKTGNHWDARLEYTGEFAHHFDSDTGSLKVSYKF